MITLDALLSLPLAEKIGQLFLVSLDGPALDAEAAAFLDRCRAGNVILFAQSIQSRAQVTQLNRALAAHITARCGLPPLLSLDHEGGRVMRFRDGATAFPSAMAVAASGSAANATAIGRAMGTELRAMGFSLNYAPVLDVNANAQNPVIGLRAYGDHPMRVAQFGVAMAQGLQSASLAACGKHFPGHGDTAVDSHFGLPRVEKDLATLETMDLYPFAAAIDAGIDAIMTSHILFPALEPDGLPATLSPRILQGLLRQRMGFDGLLISDGMQMQAIASAYGVAAGCVLALRAGVDLLCVGSGGKGHQAVQIAAYEAVVHAVQSGEIPMARVDEALARQHALKARLCAAPPVPVDWHANAALAQRVSDASTCWLRGGPIALSGHVLCASAAPAAQAGGIAEGDWRTAPFAVQLSQALDNASAHLIPSDAAGGPLPPADAYAVAIGQGTGAELSCLRAALATGQPTAAVLTGLPYVAARLPASCPALCIWGITPHSVRTAAQMLRGCLEASGHSPVRV